MLHRLLQTFWPHLMEETPLRLFDRVTVRAAMAFALAFLLSLVFGPWVIRRLRVLKMGQQVRQFKTADTQQFNIHQHKVGTPTMGGILVVGATCVAAVTFCDPFNSYFWVVLVVMLATAALGFADDFQKIARKNHKGVSARTKLVVQMIVGLALGAFLYFSPSHTSYRLEMLGNDIILEDDAYLLVPFFKTVYPYLGLWMLLWAALVIAGTSNAVNLTDGLDGLAIGNTITVCLPYVAITYIVSRIDFSAYLFVPHVPEAGDLSVFLMALLGASFGFLWFNAHPAEVFMGDTGSLSIGAVIGAVALLSKHEILLLLVGGIFVAEALSVMVQVYGFRRTGKRILLMSPLHNHYVKKGMDESKIIARFLIVATLLSLVGLSTLKLR